MAILFNKIQKAQNGIMMQPVEGQLSPSGKAKFINGKWTGVIQQSPINIEDRNQAASVFPQTSLYSFEDDKNKGDNYSRPLPISPGAITNTLLRPVGVDVMAGDTTYNAIPKQNLKEYYSIPYTKFANKTPLTLKSNTDQKGKVISSTHFLGKK